MNEQLHISEALVNNWTTPISDSAHTLSGKVIAAIADLRPQPRSSEQAQELGRQADLIAEVFADTVCMTRLAAPKAALLRAALLAAPDKKPSDLLVDTLSNAAEGAVLNRITCLTNPIYTERKLTLQKELQGHLTAGSAMAATKAVFDQYTWQDGSGKINLAVAAEKVCQAGVLGGIINVPAGTIATKLIHLGPVGRWTDIQKGVLSGGAAGLVSSGIQSHLGLHTDNLTATLTEGCLIGAFGGASGSALLRTSWFANRPRVFSYSNDAKTHPRLRADLNALCELDVVHEEHSSLARLNSEIEATGYQLKDLELRVLQPDKNAQDYLSEADFLAEATTARMEPARVYKLRGVEVWIPDNYAAQLDQVMDLRLAAEETTRFGQYTTRANEAFDTLQEHPLRDNAHLADLLPTLNVPNPSLIKRVIVNPAPLVTDTWTNLHDSWIKNNYKSTFTTEATASTDGEITFYRPNRQGDLVEAGMHEWSHLLHFSSPRTIEIWPKASYLEKKFKISTYAQKDYWENFAEHGAVFLSPDWKLFHKVAGGAPLRSLIVNETIQSSFADAKAAKIVPKTLSDLSSRLDYVDKEVTPVALEYLSRVLKNCARRKASRAAFFLAEYGGPDELATLRTAALKDPDPLIRRSAKRAADKLYGSLLDTGSLLPDPPTASSL